jgi:hypothetical protein
MKAAYNNRTNGFKKMAERIDFDPGSMTAEELRGARTKEEIFQKLKVIFSQCDEHGSRSGVTENNSRTISTRTFGKVGGHAKSVA